VRRVDQTNASEYDSASQARVWGGSTCSAASLTALLRSRGVNVRISDVMKAMSGGITPELGLISRPALVKAAARFGLQAREDVTSYESLRSATAAGQPVMVDVRNQRFPEGHWMVVTSTDAKGVNVVDSSGYKLTSLSRDEFMRSWSGRGIRVLN
jgi:ABC-type bacteriocin/lantibiotic exporter with double-glycine peptidase domain